MTASLHVGCRLSGESIAAGTTENFPPSCSVEDAATAAKGVIVIGEDGTIDLPFARIISNSLSGSCALKLQKGGVDQLTITVTSTSTGIQEEGTPSSFAVAAGDEVGWVAVAAAGTGTIEISMLGFWFTPDTSGNCVTLVSTFAAGSFPVSDLSTSWPLPLNGARNSDTEANLAVRLPVAATVRGLYIVTGTNNRTEATEHGVRAEAVDLLEHSVAGLAAGVFPDSPADSDAIAADDDCAFFLRTNGSGSGTYNLERIAAELLTTSNKCFFIAGSGSTINLDADVGYIPIAGELGFSTTEAVTQVLIRKSIRVHHLIVKVDSNNATVNGNSVRLRKNGADTGLVCRINGDTGIFEDTEHFVDLVSGDLVNLKVDDGSGSNPIGVVQIRWALLLGDATGAGGGEAPTPPTFAIDAQTGVVDISTSGTAHVHRPGVQSPIGVLVEIMQSGSSADDVSAVTYGGVAMTREPTNGFAQDTTVELLASYAYTLDSGVPEGNQNVVVTHGGGGSKSMAIVTFKGSGGISVVASGKAQENQANPHVSLDSGAETAIRFAACATGLGNPINITPDTGFSKLPGAYDWGASSGAFVSQDTPSTGSVSTGVNMSTDDVAMVAVAIAEVAAAGDLSISVSSAIAVAEAATLALTPLLLSASDAVSVAESQTLALTPLLLSAFDAVAVAESQTLALTPLLLSVSDAITVAESRTLNLGDTSLSIDVADAVSIAEAETLALTPLLLSVADAISVAESNTLALTPLLLSVSDAIAVAESRTLTLGDASLIIDVAEVVSVAEAQTLALTPLLISVSDTISVAESAATLFDVLLLSVSDAISVADSSTLTLSGGEFLAINVNDTLTVVEARTLAITPLLLSVSDAIAVAEFTNAAVDLLLLSVSDAIAVTESASYDNGFTAIFASPGDPPTSTVLVASLTSTVVESSLTESD